MVFFDVLPYIFFITGIVVGSFLHVCAYRIPRGESILFPPSRCTCCGRRIKAVDLAPLLNYLWLKSRRRFCGGKISISHPLVELLTGLLFMTACLRFGLSIELIKALLLTSILVVISIIDMEYLIIPNKLIVIVLFLGAIFVIFTGEPAVLSALMGFGAAFLFLLALALASRGGIGGGDIKLAAVIGLCLGWPNGITAVLLACLLAGLAGLILILLRIKNRKDLIPFGPFLAAGALIMFHSGYEIISWYLKHLL
ncbi:MAG: Type 4 prepilin-like proteins leader peptide-processing enzyme [Firmicutes bacterium ADurb.Bin373]|nr:prepilin peptidase [Bacillota bacterium]OQA10934.1 MAG: Type 4 prepilin-like proteins leader peptide-processing enzyme [Firmicutes bacterium ADurb.Bin373]